MRRYRKRNRATWFPILGFDTAAAAAGGLSTVDVRQTAVAASGAPNVIVIPIIPDIDIPPEQNQLSGGRVAGSLRDYVEGQSCIIERVVGSIQHSLEASQAKVAKQRIIVCSAVAIVPTSDDGTGDPAVSAEELDPLRADNSQQPWYWRRVWVLGDGGFNDPVDVETNFPQNNLFGSVAEGSKIDTKGVKRVIRREERIFLIHSFLNAFPSAEGENRVIDSTADLRVVGRMVRAKNRSHFK